MVTFGQLLRKNRQNRKKKWKKRALKYSPQKRGVCKKVYLLAPKKPCSANRPIARVILTTNHIVFCHLHGEGATRIIRKESVVLVRGGRPNDIPAVKYRAIRGSLQKEFKSVPARVSSRSLYGVKGSRDESNRVVRKNRRLAFLGEIKKNRAELLTARENRKSNWKKARNKIVNQSVINNI